MHSLPAFLAAVGIGMLVWGVVSARPLWVDEQMILLNVRDRAWDQLAGPLWLDQSAPLGWFVLERMIVLAVGEGERVVRMLTAAFGAATLITALWIGRRWMSGVGAILLVAMCATGQWLVFFTLELKHYSSDAFWALLLPALAAWALEPQNEPETLVARTRTWWVIAAVGQWFANGALFVTPLVGIFLGWACWRRVGVRRLAGASIGLAVWLVSFGFNFVVTLRPALHNAYLANYWTFAFPPAAGGVVATAHWIVAQLRPIAIKPGGTALTAWFWIAWAVGITYAIVRRNALGWLFGAVPASALALALFRLVPPFERLGIWFVPSLYVGIALCADSAIRLVRSRRPIGRIVRVGAAIVGAAAVAVSANVAYRGVRAFAARPRSNYGLDDRNSVRYLLARHRRGDPILATHYGTAALWWYGQVDVGAPNRGTRLWDGSPIFEVKYPEQSECGVWDAELTRTLAGHTRADLYLGFRQNVEPENFEAQVIAELSERGQIVSDKAYAEKSRIVSFDLMQATRHPVSVPGCISIRSAKRW